jgi:hypothetical protein
MPKNYQKKKSPESGPNATGPSYRTPSSFRGNSFSDNKFNAPGKANTVGMKFNPAQFKTQHKG